MKRKVLLPSLCLLCLPLLSACMGTGNPLVKAEATPVPGVPMALHSAAASQGNESELVATLYFRYLDKAYLASETRILTVQKDESNEMAVVRALLEGPSAEKLDLRRLFRDDVSILSVADSGGRLTVTFNEAFLHSGQVADGGQAQRSAADLETDRWLAVQSVVNTLTENFTCSSVQFMISRSGDARADTRLDRSFFSGDQSGPCDPFQREEGLLLTSHNVAGLLLKAWQERDYETLYRFTASYADHDPRPVYGEFTAALDAAQSLAGYGISPGSVTEDGQRATLTVQLTLLEDGAAEAQIVFPMRLQRENGIWKTTYSSLRRMMLP